MVRVNELRLLMSCIYSVLDRCGGSVPLIVLNPRSPGLREVKTILHEFKPIPGVLPSNAFFVGWFLPSPAYYC